MDIFLNMQGELIKVKCLSKLPRRGLYFRARSRKKPSDLLLKPCHKKQESLNHEGTKDTKEESTKGFGFSFAGKTANEKAAFLKTVARFSKNTLLTVLNLVTFVSLWFNNLLLWVAGKARVRAIIGTDI
jgi:hypothetical protein